VENKLGRLACVAVFAAVKGPAMRLGEAFPFFGKLSLSHEQIFEREI
jgi:hypothetical protein